MLSEQALVVTLVLVVPSTLLLLAFFLLRRPSKDARLQASYEFIIFGHRFVTTRAAVLQLLSLFALTWWLDWFLPFSLALFIFVVGLFSLVRARELTPKSTSDETAALLQRLSAMQAEVAKVHDHVQLLTQNVATTQSDLDQKEQAKAKLEEAIKGKKEEAELWDKMTDAQRAAFLETAVSAIARGTRGQFWWGLLLGFVINILATMTWAIMGNPGKDEILKKLDAVASLVTSAKPSASAPVGEPPK